MYGGRPMPYNRFGMPALLRALSCPEGKAAIKSVYALRPHPFGRVAKHRILVVEAERLAEKD
jgi:hypothetical protein